MRKVRWRRAARAVPRRAGRGVAVDDRVLDLLEGDGALVRRRLAATSLAAVPASRLSGAAAAPAHGTEGSPAGLSGPGGGAEAARTGSRRPRPVPGHVQHRGRAGRRCTW